jgi:anti-sigma factor RsiW
MRDGSVTSADHQRNGAEVPELSSTSFIRRRSRLTAALVAALASVALGAGTGSRLAQHPAPGAQTARSSWSSSPAITASVEWSLSSGAGIVGTNRSSWS